MKLTGGRAQGFVRSGPSDERVVLFHGPDSGAVSEYAESVAGTIVEDLGDPFRVETFDGSELRAEPGSLLASVDAVAFGGGRRVIRVRGAGDMAAPAVQAVLDESAGDGVVVLEAGELSARSKLRSLCEKHENAVSIGCYAADDADRGAFVEMIAGEFGLSIAPDVRNLVAGLLGNDRGLNRSEVEKLCYYVGPESGSILEADVRAALIDNGEADVDAVLLHAMLGRFDPLMTAFDRFDAGGGSTGGLVRQGIRLVDRLIEARSKVDGGQSAASAVDGLRPPVFFGIKPMVVRIVSTWPRDRLFGALDVLGETEAASRTAGAVEREVTERGFFRIAQVGRRLAAR